MLTELLRYKKIIFAFLLTIICVIVFFRLCVSVQNMVAIYSRGNGTIEPGNVKEIKNELRVLDALVKYNVNDVSNILLRVFNDETTIIHYGSSEKVTAEHAFYFIHKIAIQGEYEDIVKKIDQLERVHPSLFIINVKINQNIELRRNEIKTKKTNDLGAEITVMHCSF